jgi:hypothetical protein
MSFYDSFGNSHIIKNNIEEFSSQNDGLGFCNKNLSLVRNCKSLGRYVLVHEIKNTNKQKNEFNIVTCCSCINDATSILNSKCNSKIGGKDVSLNKPITSATSDLSNNMVGSYNNKNKLIQYTTRKKQLF